MPRQRAPRVAVLRVTGLSGRKTSSYRGYQSCFPYPCAVDDLDKCVNRLCERACVPMVKISEDLVMPIPECCKKWLKCWHEFWCEARLPISKASSSRRSSRSYLDIKECFFRRVGCAQRGMLVEYLVALKALRLIKLRSPVKHQKSILFKLNAATLAQIFLVSFSNSL